MTELATLANKKKDTSSTDLGSLSPHMAGITYNCPTYPNVPLYGRDGMGIVQHADPFVYNYAKDEMGIVRDGIVQQILLYHSMLGMGWELSNRSRCLYIVNNSQSN